MTAVLIHAERTEDTDRLRWIVSGGGHPTAGELLARLAGLGVADVAECAGGYELTKLSSVEWRAIGDQIRHEIRAVVADAARAVPGAAEVAAVIEATVGDTLRAHGGSIEVVGVDAEGVVLRLSGACSGCGGAASTVDERVASALRRRFPAVPSVRVVHAERVAWRGLLTRRR